MPKETGPGSYVRPVETDAEIMERYRQEDLATAAANAEKVDKVEALHARREALEKELAEIDEELYQLRD